MAKPIETDDQCTCSVLPVAHDAGWHTEYRPTQGAHV